MARQFWFNLPVKDINRSKQFYRGIGFKENEMHKDANHLASFYVDDNKTVMMLFPEADIQHYAANPVTDTTKSTEVLLNIDAQTKEEVDAMVKTVESAGGTVYTQPNEVDGWMYGLGFMDPDGHRWVMLHMDITKMPKQ
ncbi:VOC family protein [Mariniflexile maritimum]|jgi:predicted lactoylglutathione lyase|uniref:VOC family protein n=1 Tax=Mariniflexile maritimum TaxID=2682493 RepID=UPI0012F6D999|nr:VOC family protein [Mariniflexile maritimum]MCB0450907.1 VOC family protein [Confluentibacter sp.]